MKTIGLLGGMSWESTQTYYQLINEAVRRRLGKQHSAKIVMVSVDFESIETCQRQGDWSVAGDILAKAAKDVEAANAECLLICTNTMHKVFERIEKAVCIPLIHIADATGERLVKDKVSKVGLLGTCFTMEQAFYKQRLADKFGIEVVVPESKARRRVHDIIYNELCQGEIKPDSKQDYLGILRQLATDGVQAVILGCTEIGLLISSADTSIPLYDTAQIHALQAVEFALGG